MSTQTEDDQRQDESQNPGQREWLQNAEFKPSSEESKDKSDNSDSNLDSRQAVANKEKRSLNDSAGGRAVVDAASKTVGTVATPVAGKVVQLLGKIKSNKKTTLAGIVVVIILGVIGLGLVLAPNFALINFKENLLKELDSQTAALTERADNAFMAKLFTNGNGLDTSGTCAIKVKCRYVGISPSQRTRMIEAGITFENESVKKLGPLTRYSASAIKFNGQTVTAQNYKRTIRSSADFRVVIRSIYKPRYAAFTDKVAESLRSRIKYTRNPNWDTPEQDKNAIRKGVYLTQNPDGNTSRVDGGTPLDGSETDPDNKIDYGSAAEDINAEVEDLKAKGLAGEPIDRLPTDVAEVAAMPPYEGRGSLTKVLTSVGSFLNPADIGTWVCTAYQLTNSIIITSKTVQLANTMRYAANIAAVADKAKAGDVSGREMTNVMNILMKPDSSGDVFDTSFGHQYITTGKLPSKPIAFSAAGSDAVRTMSTALRTFENSAGNKTVVRSTCKALTNPFVIGALSLTSFIPGAGQLTRLGTAVIGKGSVEIAQTAAKNAIRQAVEAVTRRATTTEGRKATLTAARNQLKREARNPINAIFLAIMLTESYGVPAIAQMLSGTTLNGDESGPVALDATITGIEAISEKTGQERGLSHMNRDQYIEYRGLEEDVMAQYEEEQRYLAQQTPYDITNQYSIAGSLATAISPLQTAFYSETVGSSLSRIAAIPQQALSGLFGVYSSGVSAATTLQDELDYCGDEYYDSLNLAVSPFCNPKVGFTNMSMLEETTPDEVIEYMYSSNFIDDNGQPIDGSEYAEFKAKCFDSSKLITDFAIEGGSLDESCYTSSNQAATNTSDATATLAATTTDQKHNMFRLYALDWSVYQGFNDMWGDDELGISDLDTAAPGDPSDTPVPPVSSGNVSALALQLLTSPNITFTQTLAKTALENAAKGLPSAVEARCGGGSAVLSASLLEGLVRMSYKYRIGIGYFTSGCHMKNSLHYSGRAVDINTVNGARATGYSQLDREFMIDFANILPSGSGLGQKECMGPIPLPPGIKYFKDSCNHLHVDVPS